MKKILYFSASWCGPCKQMAPIVTKLQSEGLSINKIDVDNNQKLSTEYSIRSIPAFVLIDSNGNELKRLAGGQTEESIKNFYNN